MGNLLTTKQLADLLQISEQTIYGWKKSKGLPYLQVEQTVRYDEEQVMAWLKTKGKK